MMASSLSLPLTFTSCSTSRRGPFVPPSLPRSFFPISSHRVLTSKGFKPAPLTISPIVASLASPRKKIFFDDEEEETEDEIRTGYEALYGPAFSGLRTTGKPGRRGRGDDGEGSRGGRDSFQERVVQIRRVTKVVKGGKQLSFRAIVVVGDKRGRVGVGVGSAKEVVAAVQKSAVDARRHVVSVPMTKYRTFPHRADGKFGAAMVMLRPAATGTGVIAGGSVRVVLELAGIENALGKEIGSKNPLNNARAVVNAVSQMKQFSDVARDRGIPMEELWK